MAAAPGAPRPAPIPQAVGHSPAYHSQGTYRGAGPNNPNLRAVGHSPAYRGSGKYVSYNPYGGALFDPTASLSGKALADAAKSISDAQTAGPLAELARAIAQNNTQGAAAQKQTAGYFDQLGKYVQQSNQQQSGIANDLTNALQGIGQQTQSQIGQAFAPSAPMQSLASQGLAGGGAQSLQSGQANASAVAGQNAGAFGAAGALQSGNYRQLSNSNLGTYGLRGQETLGRIAQATRLANEPLASKQAGLIASKGSLYSTALGKLRSDERNYLLARAGLGIKQDQLKAAAAQNTFNNKLKVNQFGLELTKAQNSQMNADRQFNLDKQRFGASQAKDNYLRTHGLGPYKPGTSAGGKPRVLPVSQQDSRMAQIGQLESVIKAMSAPLSPQAAQKLGMKQGARLNETQIRDLLKSGNNPTGKSFDPVLIEAAYEHAGWGVITPHTAGLLHQLGIPSVGKYGYKIGQPAKGSVSQTVGNIAANLGGF